MIVQDPKICGGQPCVDVDWQGNHTKVLVSRLVQLKGDGHTNGDLIRMFSGLRKKQIQEAVRYAKGNSHA